MIQREEQCLQVFRFRRLEWRVQIPPTKLLALVPSKNIRLARRADGLQPNIYPVKGMVRIRQQSLAA